MATTETQVNNESSSSSPLVKEDSGRRSISDRAVWAVDQILRLLSSVRFGIIMLSMLLICSMTGMLIMQKDIEDFDKYYAKLTPAQQLIYTKLNLFDIYHSRYFTLLLAITALNIILASIDRFPTAWQYIIKPKLKASPNFIRAQMFSREAEIKEQPQKVVEQVQMAWKKMGWRSRVSQEGDRITVFAQKNPWNRLGAYFVHVALMLIFIGGFLTNWYGVGGNMEIVPGEASDTFVKVETTLEGPKLERVKLPFSIECTDLQQRLIRPEGGLEATNTIDWLSYVKIKDGGNELPALVHLNNPYDYKGFRLFQSKFTAVGHARSIKVRFEPVNGGNSQEVQIPRNGTVEVPGIGKVSYKDFYPDFEIKGGGPSSASGDYNNPAAQLEITGGDGKARGAFAFNRQLADKFLSSSKSDSKSTAQTGVGAKGETGKKNTESKADEDILLVNGYKPILVDFEKAALGHTLTLQYDPGRKPAYLGFVLLILSLCSVFFFAHQRVWAVIEPGEKGSKAYFGGNTNRNRPAFEGRFNSIVESVIGGSK